MCTTYAELSLHDALPISVELLRKIVALVFLISTGWVVGVAIARNRRWLLWRVRRKLLLSYLFLGVVPLVLVLAFALAGGVVRSEEHTSELQSRRELVCRL